MTQCYCGSEMKFTQCCQPFLLGLKQPKTAEQLMRSRYCAYVCRDATYLVQTELNQVNKNSGSDLPNVRWDHLEICQTVAGTESDDSGCVEFKAFFYDQENRYQCLWEESQFIKKGASWRYSEGIILN